MEKTKKRIAILVEDLYNDYFYRRQEDFWQACGYEKLPAMRKASPMLLCGEDLGMVPACVPGVKWLIFTWPICDLPSRKPPPCSTHVCK